MLKQTNRLKSKRSYTATYNNRNIVSDENMVVYAGKIKTDENCPTRVGFVVSKKVHKRATKRNRIKRLIRENIRLMLKNNELAQLNNYQSLIFMAKEDILDKNFEEIRNTILILMDKLANKNI
ncbi:MAG: ribonuclease P protein component [Cyanobacteria bacterium SIG27]|nr:ribonuclease P protein component [Cyanobacteria bacterium SIG27]MBQ9150167.1 ribonuclease P protein component [bacterium]